MADLSLGPLKITNPDPRGDVSPQSTTDAASSSTSLSAVSPITGPAGPNGLIPQRSQDNRSPVSPLESPPAMSTQAAAAAASTTRAQTDRTQHRQSIPYTYQDQQQAQFPQYPTMMPQNLHSPQSNSTRPVSSFYTQPPSKGSSKGNGGIGRENSYRMRSDSSRQATSIPQRSTSRGSAAALQAGVPTNDGSHTERAYKQTQYTSSSGPAPPRKVSNGIASGRLSNSPSNNNNTPLSNNTLISKTLLSGAPYNLEGGPLSSSEEWKERGAAVSIQQDYDANGKPVSVYIKKGVKDFNFGQTLGEGSYSTVLAATDRQTLKEYAIKVLDKRHIIKEKKVKYVNIEKDTLNRLTNHPGIVRLYYTFQDERSLYFVLDLASGGELLGVLKRMGTFDEQCTRFYGAQILDTIEYMHKRGVIHRDLKPENVLLDDKMHVKITDFGTAKILDISKPTDGGSSFQPDSMMDDDRASSFVGTAEYVSPELLTDKNACKASDLWAFGCIIYQLLAGRPPFKAGNEYQTFQKIVALDYEFPRGFPEVARDLIERLLVLDPQRRLSIEHIKNHMFFDGIIWGTGLWQQKAPRLKTYTPPTPAPIKLNEPTSNNSYPRDVGPSHSTQPTILPPVTTPHKASRVITELPPPSQLDIEWSPVLTRNNERILKLGNLSVLSTPKPHSPHNGGDGGGKLSRLFGGSGAKKRQRLVMVTSSARIIMAAAGGEEKRSKSEISLMQPGCHFSSSTDAKGVPTWSVDTRDKQYIFEDIKSTSTDAVTKAASSQSWLETMEWAKDLAAQDRSTNAAYNEDDSFNMSASAMSSHENTLDQASQVSPLPESGHPRGTLHKQHSGPDVESMKGRKRFSKRQSKSGLTAVF